MDIFTRFSNMHYLIWQFHFINRITAADLLSSYITTSIHKFNKNERKTAIFGIPRGGVVIANVISKRLQSDYKDIIITKRLRSPFNKEVSIGAIAEDGSLFINQYLVKKLNIPNEYLIKERNICLKEIKYKRELYDNKLEKNKTKENISNNITVIVDDGSATGASFIAAAKCLRKYNPFKIIVAAPIIPNDVFKLLNQETDATVAILKPKKHFYYIQQFYKDFNTINENEVINILKKW